MLSPYIYHALLLGVCVYAFLAGRSEERIAAAICAVATVATRLVLSPTINRYSQIEAGVFLVDLAVLAGFAVIALRSERFWPLWIAGLQLATTIAHILKAARFELIPEVYAAAARFWVYPIFLIIVVGTWRTHKRHRLEGMDEACPS